MAAANPCASTSLAGQALDLSSNALAGKANAGEACLSIGAKATYSIRCEADPGECDSDSSGLSSDPDTKNYTGHSQGKWSVANDSYKRSHLSKEDKKMKLWTERNPRALELNHMMTSNTHIDGTPTERLAVPKRSLQQGISSDSGSYVKVLRTCLKQKDLLATKQVHDCIIQSGMDKNPYVARTLMSVYIKCGALVDARCVFDQLETKNVVDWTIMIAGYPQLQMVAYGTIELYL